MKEEVSSTTLTCGQLQRQLAQRVQRLYREQLGHTSGKISCQLFDDKVTLIIEDSITKPEQLLVEEGEVSLVKQVRADLDTALRPQLESLIQEVLGQKVVDLMSDVTLETGRTGIIIVLSEAPQVRKSA